jgi:hypothetical protein
MSERNPKIFVGSKHRGRSCRILGLRHMGCLFIICSGGEKRDITFRWRSQEFTDVQSSSSSDRRLDIDFFLMGLEIIQPTLNNIRDRMWDVWVDVSVSQNPERTELTTTMRKVHIFASSTMFASHTRCWKLPCRKVERRSTDRKPCLMLARCQVS